MASLSSRCSRSADVAAIGDTERRSVAKTRLCKFYAQGSCRRGNNCSYAHGNDELQRGPWHGNRRQSSHRNPPEAVLMRTPDGHFQTSDKAEEQSAYLGDDMRAGRNRMSIPAPPQERQPPQHLQHTSHFAPANSEQAQQNTLAPAATLQQGIGFLAPPPLPVNGLMGMAPSPMPVVQVAGVQPTMAAGNHYFYTWGGQAFVPGPLGIPVGNMAPQHPSAFPHQPPPNAFLVAPPPRVQQQQERPMAALSPDRVRHQEMDVDDDAEDDDGDNASLSIPPAPQPGRSSTNRDRQRRLEEMYLHESALRELQRRRARRHEDADLQEAIRRSRRQEDAEMQEAIRRSLADEYTGGYGSQPLSKTEIDNFTTGFVFSQASFKDTECPICLDEFEDGDNLHVLKCGHAYHEGCIGSWLSRSSQCPMCKHNVRP